HYSGALAPKKSPAFLSGGQLRRSANPGLAHSLCHSSCRFGSLETASTRARIEGSVNGQFRRPLRFSLALGHETFLRGAGEKFGPIEAGRLSGRRMRRLGDGNLLPRRGPCRRIEVEAPRERRVLPWHLAVLRGLDYIVADVDEQRIQVIVGRRNALHQRTGEGRVSPRTVLRHVAGLRGETDERADTGFHPREASADVRRSRSHGASEAAGERTVAA